MNKHKTVYWQREWWAVRIRNYVSTKKEKKETILEVIVKKDFWGGIELRVELSVRVGHVSILKESVPGKGNSKFKGPKV